MPVFYEISRRIKIWSIPQYSDQIYSFINRVSLAFFYLQHNNSTSVGVHGQLLIYFGECNILQGKNDKYWQLSPWTALSTMFTYNHFKYILFDMNNTSYQWGRNLHKYLKLRLTLCKIWYTIFILAFDKFHFRVTYKYKLRFL